MKCWYCGKAEMEDTNDGFHPFKKCPECGATWCDVPELAPSILGAVEVKSITKAYGVIKGYKSKRYRKK